VNNFEISLPDPHNPGTFTASDPMTRGEAIRIAREVWGADKDGKIRIINELPVE
jgi:hypothetical protein